MYNKISTIFNAFSDDISKELFLLRLNYNLSKSDEVLNQIMKATLSLVSTDDIFLSCNNDKIYSCDKESKWILYGTGLLGKIIFNIFNLKEHPNVIICDKNSGGFFYNKPIISPKELVSNHCDSKIIIASNTYYDEIATFLNNNGIYSSHFYRYNIFNLVGNQYYDSFITLNNNETFVDAGVFDCDTTLKFIERTNNSYKAIYQFEPDTQNHIFCQKTVSKLNAKDIHLYNLGLWNQKDTLSFNDSSTASSAIDSNALTKISVDALDNIINEEVSFIKMDIEGAELKALEGAQNIIKKYKPKLAISVYHKDEDIIDIPNYILELVPDYNLYLRFYNTCLFEWVIYAIPNKNN